MKDKEPKRYIPVWKKDSKGVWYLDEDHISSEYKMIDRREEDDFNPNKK